MLCWELSVLLAPSDDMTISNKLDHLNSFVELTEAENNLTQSGGFLFIGSK